MNCFLMEFVTTYFFVFVTPGMILSVTCYIRFCVKFKKVKDTDTELLGKEFWTEVTVCCRKKSGSLIFEGSKDII